MATNQIIRTSAQSFVRELSSEQHTPSVNVDDEHDKALLLDKLSVRKVPLWSALAYTCIRRSTLVLVVLFLLYIFFAGYTLLYAVRTYTSGSTLHGFIDFPYVENPIRIVLLGDSLVNKPFWMFDLGGKIADMLPSYTYQIYNQAQDGRTISRIRHELLPAVLARKPHALLMLWDTDCSDVDESDMSAEEVAGVRAAFVSDLRYVINATLSAGTMYMAVGSPSLLGEGGWLGDTLLESKFKNKQGMLDEYRNITRAVCQDMGVRYMDIRHAMRAAKPFFWPLNMFSVTIDGEHPSNLGARVLAQQFSKALKEWLSSF
jgi:hypothetical protein